MIDRCYLEITNICNLDCVFCAGHRRQPRSLTEEEFELLAEKLKGHVKFLYFHLMGEPMLHRSLPRFISSARSKGFVPVLTTNGTLLDGAAAVAEAGLYKVNVSLHSYEGNTDGLGADDCGLERYVSSVAQFAGQASANGTVVVLRLWNRGGYDSENQRILEHLHRFFPGTWLERENGITLAPKLYLEYDGMFTWPDKAGKELGTEAFCYALRNQIGVLADGSVVPCCLDHDGDMTLGNLFSQSLDEILSSERARRMYDGFTSHKAVEPMCRRCGYAMITKRFRT